MSSAASTRTIYILPAGSAVPSQQKPTLYRPVRVARLANVNVLRPSPSPASSPTQLQLLPSSPSIIPQNPPSQKNAKHLKRPLSIDDLNDLIDHHSQGGSSVPRKRERLTHLTREEKQQRRKMKNREAAQAARDRKKDRTGKLEEALLNAVAESQEKSETIARQEEIIRNQRAENDRLKEELAALRQQLQLGSSVAQMAPQQMCVDVQNPSGTPTEPAAFANPQPRDGVLMPLALMFTAMASLRICDDLFGDASEDDFWPQQQQQQQDFCAVDPSCAGAAACIPSTSAAHPMLPESADFECDYLMPPQEMPWNAQQQNHSPNAPLHLVPSPGSLSSASLHYATSPSFDSFDDLYPSDTFLKQDERQEVAEESFLDAIGPLVADFDLDEFMKLPIY